MPTLRARRLEPSSRLQYLLKRALAQLDELNTKALEPLGIDPRDLGVLLALTGEVAMSQLAAAQRLGIDRTTMVIMLDRLEAAGLVSRRPDPGDRRRNVVGLTVLGRNTVGKAVEASDRAERDLLAPLGAAAAQQLRGALRAVVGGPSGGSARRSSD